MLQLVLASLLAAGVRVEPRDTSQKVDKELEEEISRELGAAPAPQSQPAPAAPGDSGRLGGSPLARLQLLPDISAIGSFGLVYDSYDAAVESPRFGLTSKAHDIAPAFQELELALQSVVDPYARADIFISFTPKGVEVEEAYLTTLSLPAGLQLRAGIFKSPFGRMNQQHPHTWDFADGPLALNRLVAEESLAGPGVDLAWLAPLPWFFELHLAGQTTVPAGVADDNPRRTALVRLIQYFGLGEAATLGIGLSAARTEGGGEVAARDLGAVDVYLKLRPPTSRAYLALQGELFGRRFAGSSLGEGELGGYAQAVWRAGPYWAFGARYDNAPAVVPEGAEPGAEHRYSAIATWLPSEFQRIRLQLAYDRRPGGREGIEALLHLEFAIGAHGAHPF